MQINNFICLNCHKSVSLGKDIGTANRNHCPFCLYSKHVDLEIPGDRKAKCQGLMRPIGLTFKKVSSDKWNKEKQGELMLIHVCLGCQKISINRIAGDDLASKILEVLTNPQNLDQTIKDNLNQSGIELLNSGNLPEIKTQLFGNHLV